MANGGGGGVIYSGNRFANASLVNNTFIGNSAAFCGVLDIDEFSHYSIAIENSNFTRNRAVGQVDGANGGGVFCVRNGSITVQNSSFSHNSAEGNAGVALIDESEITIENSNFTNNTAIRDGGVFYTYFYPTRYTIIDSSFSENQAGNDGGVMYVGRAGSHVTLRRNDIANNEASERGGVLAIIGSSLFISGDNSIRENTARLGEIASTCNTQVTAFGFPALASPDSVQPQCTLYDHSDTTLPPITTLEVTLANTDDHPSTTETEESDTTSNSIDSSPKSEPSTTVEATFSGEDFTTTATPQLDTTTSFNEVRTREAGNNTISYVAIALASILFILVVGLAVALPIHFTRRLNAMRAKATSTNENFIMTTNGIYQSTSQHLSVLPDSSLDQGDYEYTS